MEIPDKLTTKTWIRSIKGAEYDDIQVLRQKWKYLIDPASIPQEINDMAFVFILLATNLTNFNGPREDQQLILKK